MKEFSGSLEHAEVMFDALAGVEGRWRAGVDDNGDIWINLMLPIHRRSAFVQGQSFYGVGVRCQDTWLWAEELRVYHSKRCTDGFGDYWSYCFISNGAVWSGRDPERLEKRPTTSAA